jgi:uncharacterized protein YceH (UPF0502 family)
MALVLHPTEVRVLGCLIEKEITTPEYYPLTLNALTLACNQKSNRDPVVTFDENIVLAALELLRQKRLVNERTGTGYRVPKYVHRFTEVFNLGRREIALMCELMVRGPQTTGELRTRSERMHAFTDLQEVEACLDGLMQFEAQPLVTRLPRQQGTKESRYAHLLSGEPSVPEPAPVSYESAPVRGAAPDRVASLESEVQALRERLDRLEQQFGDFRRAFE